MKKQAKGPKQWWIIVRDADGSRVGNIPVFHKLKAAREWINGKMAWLHRNSYTVDLEVREAGPARGRKRNV